MTLNNKKPSLFKYTKLFDFILTICLVNTVINVITINYSDFEKSNFEFIIVGMSFANTFILCGAPLFVSSMLSKQYSLMCTMPFRSSKVPEMISSSCDIIHGLNFVIEVVLTILIAGVEVLPMRLIRMAVMYILANTLLYLSVNPELKVIETSKESVKKSGVYFFLYLGGYCTIILLYALQSEKYSYTARLVMYIIFAFLCPLSVIVRYLSGKGVKNKIRVVKLYNTKKVKKQKVESYI